MKKSALARTLASALLLFLTLGVFAQGIDNIMLDAVEKYQAGQYKAAKDQLHTLSQAAPGNDAVWYYLALCEAEMGEVASAVAHMTKAASIDPGNYWYRQRLALLYAASGNVAKEIEIFEALKKDFPKKAYNISFDLVNLYIEAERFDDALAALDDVERISGVDEQSLRVRFDIYRNSGRDDEAAAIAEEFCREQPSAQMLTLLGDLHMDYDRHAEALDCYTKALAMDSDYVPALLGKSEVYRVTKQMDEYFGSMREFMSSPAVSVQSKCMYINNAVKAIDPRAMQSMLDGFDSIVLSASQVHPTDSTMLTTAARYSLATGRPEKAEAFLLWCADADPSSLGREVNYVAFLEYMEQWARLRERAEQDFARFGDTGFLDYAISAAISQDDYDGAIGYAHTILKNSQKGSPAQVVAWAVIGDMNYLNGSKSKAFRAYEKVLSMEPGYYPVLNNYAYYLATSRGCLKKAEKMAAKAVELAPTEATYLDTYGWILHLRKKDAEARPVFQRAMGYGGKESAVMLDHYAEVLFSLGEYSLAKEYWKQALAKNNGQIPDLEERVAKREKSMTSGR